MRPVVREIAVAVSEVLPVCAVQIGKNGAFHATEYQGIAVIPEAICGAGINIVHGSILRDVAAILAIMNEERGAERCAGPHGAIQILLGASKPGTPAIGRFDEARVLG